MEIILIEGNNFIEDLLLILVVVLEGLWKSVLFVIDVEVFLYKVFDVVSSDYNKESGFFGNGEVNIVSVFFLMEN